jgi:Phosphate transporter family
VPVFDYEHGSLIGEVSSREQNSQLTAQHCQEEGWFCSFQMGIGVTELFIVITVIAVALIFDYTNGFHDSANAMAGPIATGAIRPRTAVILGAFLNLVGACLSTEVAKTISGGFLTMS